MNTISSFFLFAKMMSVLEEYREESRVAQQNSDHSPPQHLHDCDSSMYRKSFPLFIMILPFCAHCVKDLYCNFDRPGKCFIYDETQYVNLSDANQFCSGMNLTIASIDSKTENGIIRTMLGVGDSWINALTTDFSQKTLLTWTKFHSKCRSGCCGVFVSGDGVWRDDSCHELHGVICQKYILTGITEHEVLAASNRSGKSLSEPPEGNSHTDKKVLHTSESFSSTFSRIIPFLSVFSLFFITSCLTFFCLTKVSRSYSTIPISSPVL
jgi:hypothetical protein